jgi:hypothetical protein
MIARAVIFCAFPGKRFFSSLFAGGGLVGGGGFAASKRKADGARERKSFMERERRAAGQ